jgi:hypothetical protein
MRIPREEVEKQAALAGELKEIVEAICSAANEKMQSGYSLAMSSLIGEINKLCKFYAQYSGGSSGETENIEDGSSITSDAVPASGGFNLASFIPGTRSDALLLLRKGAEYFQRQEPNSPIPFLVNRALRFSEMSFIDLLEDIVPDALSHGKTILGIKE